MTIEQLLAKANKHAAKALGHREKAAKHEAKHEQALSDAVALCPKGYVATRTENGISFTITELELEKRRFKAEDDQHQRQLMQDPANWKAGDVVECVMTSHNTGEGSSFLSGGRYTVREDCNGSRLHLRDDEMGRANSYPAKKFRWISRPQ